MGKVIHGELCKKFKFAHKNQWYMHNPTYGEWDTHSPMGFWYTNRLPNLSQTTRPYNNKFKKRTYKIVDFRVLADHSVKLKESEKENNYLDLARELKKLWNMKVTFIPVVISALGTVTKGLIKGLEDLKITGQVETIQTSTIFTLARILRIVLETWGDLLLLKLQWRTINWKTLKE